MNGPISKLARCAIYTRKSTEYNLELAFNSLDAQREACEAYIKSQAHEGWRLIPGRYDDGAFSGASLDRPALQQLLADVRASQIDIVLVYKVDRLTRSLADFAKLIELFDAHGVSFVSVTQSFNTSSSMGRLTLNVLLSFAQFERELIGERVRDKIAASKRKGLWVGGPVPLGYAAVDKKIVVIPSASAARPPRGFGGAGVLLRRSPRWRGGHMWLDHLPASVAFCDVETTGLGHHDRIVSFGSIGMISRNLAHGRPDPEYLYLVFDPGMGNGRGTEQIHGFSDLALRLQDPFAVHAADVRRFLTCYELLVAHNAAFDIRFINRELTLSGLPALTRPVFCTMKGYRALGLGGSASLSAVCRHIKLARASDLHDAIEDAWLAMQIYLWLHGCPLQRRLRRSLPRTPSNFRRAETGHTVSINQPHSSGMLVKRGEQVTRLLLRTPNLRYHGRPASRPKIASW